MQCLITEERKEKKNAARCKHSKNPSKILQKSFKNPEF
jgi:hypothetical protein